MRITQSLEQTQFLSALDSLEASIATNENDVSTSLAFTTPSQDPSAAGAVNGLDQVLSQSQQFSTNATAANSSLETESTALGQFQTQLQSLYSLALEANSGTQSAADLTALGAQVTAIQSTMLSLANTQDGNGNYIFGGYATQTAPFALTATGASYAGDSGDAVFNQIKNGNGTFTVTPGPGNTGTGVIGATSVTSPAAYDGKPYTISFTGPSAYSINTVPPTTGTYTAGQAIAFDGVQISLTGTPASGDTFAVAPSTNQSIFTTVQNLITALQAPSTSAAGKTQLNNSIAAALNGIQQAITNTGTIEAQVGGRLNAITTAQSVGTSQQTQLKTSISALQSLDYPAAITTLDAENTQLSAAMQAYTLTQGLSLFKYIQ
jgi:flagellar hook-associated protein 3 FlgL